MILSKSNDEKVVRGKGGGGDVYRIVVVSLVRCPPRQRLLYGHRGEKSTIKDSCTCLERSKQLMEQTMLLYMKEPIYRSLIVKYSVERGPERGTLEPKRNY